MKTYIRIAGISLSTLIDIRVLICIISENLTRKLKLRIEANDRIKVTLLEERNKIKVIDLIPNVLITIQNLHILELLYVIGGMESVIILETDWMN